MLKAFSILNVILLNTGERNTFDRNGRGSIIDIAFVSPPLAASTNCRVSDTYTHSDHLVIIIDISSVGLVRERSGRTMKAQTKGRKDGIMDDDIFGQMLDENITVSSDANERANQLVKHISRACDAAMVRRSSSTRRPVYWWNSEIAVLRRDCHCVRRRYERSKGESDNEILFGRMTD